MFSSVLFLPSRDWAENSHCLLLKIRDWMIFILECSLYYITSLNINEFIHLEVRKTFLLLDLNVLSHTKAWIQNKQKVKCSIKSNNSPQQCKSSVKMNNTTYVLNITYYIWVSANYWTYFKWLNLILLNIYF